MIANVEKIASNKVKITFEIEAEKFDAALTKAFRDNAKKINIPGFRKGKAPLAVIQSYYGKSVFYEDAFEALFPDIYQSVVAENKLDVVDRPEIDVQQMERGKDLKLTCEVFVVPDVTLGAYKGVEIERVPAAVAPGAVDHEIEHAREHAARLVEVDRPAEMGDTVVLDYAGFDGDNQFEGGTAENHELELGSGSFIPGFEEQLVGAVAGEKRDVNVTFPAEYHAPELAGKAVVFKCEIKGIQKKELPELDDDFAQDVSEFDTFAEYKADLEAKALKTAEDNAKTQMENALVDKVVANATIDVPAAMIEDEARNMLEGFAQRLQYQGLSFDDFMKYTGQTVEQMLETYKPEAEKRVRTDLTLKAIADAEQIEPTEEEVSAKIAEYAENMKKSVEEFEKLLSEGDKATFKAMTKANKVIDMLMAAAVVVEPKPAEEKTEEDK